MKNHILKMVIISLSIVNFLNAGEKSKDFNVYNILGRRIKTIKSNEISPSSKHSDQLSTIGVNELKGEIASGIYFINLGHDFENYSYISDHDFGFIDITDTILPKQLWETGDIEITDVNNDNRGDIIFSLYSSTYDENFNYQPRIWIQNENGIFIDETNRRLPDVSVPCLDIEVFDVDDDGDDDLFFAGYQVESVYYIPAALYINDGTGIFTDQSADRLPELPQNHFVYFADNGPLDDNESPDLAIIIFDANFWICYPAIWLNDENGYFVQDSLHRLLSTNNYGFFEVALADIDSDGKNDIIFSNLRSIYQGYDPQNACYRNLGDGFFIDETETRMPQIDSDTHFATIEDIDGDNDLDILEVDFPPEFGGYSPQVRVLINDGHGYFFLKNDILPNVVGWFNDAEFARFNDDDYIDLFLINVLNGNNYDMLFMNTGDTTFSDLSSELPANLDFSVSCASFDYQGDGDVDIVIANSGEIVGGVGQNLFYQNMLIHSTVSDASNLNHPTFFLFQNYPNPFNPSTTMSFYIPKPSPAKLQVFNIQGQLIDILFDEFSQAGYYAVDWSPQDIGSGIYFYKISAGQYSATKKCVFSK